MNLAEQQSLSEMQNTELFLRNCNIDYQAKLDSGELTKPEQFEAKALMLENNTKIKVISKTVYQMATS